MRERHVMGFSILEPLLSDAATRIDELERENAELRLANPDHEVKERRERT